MLNIIYGIDLPPDNKPYQTSEGVQFLDQLLVKTVKDQPLVRGYNFLGILCGKQNPEKATFPVSLIDGSVVFDELSKFRRMTDEFVGTEFLTMAQTNWKHIDKVLKELNLHFRVYYRSSPCVRWVICPTEAMAIRRADDD